MSKFQFESNRIGLLLLDNLSGKGKIPFITVYKPYTTLMS